MSELANALLRDVAPDGAVCAHHPGAAARRTCQRCGSFICEVCRSTKMHATTTCTPCANIPDPIVVRGKQLVLAVCISQMLLILGTASLLSVRVAIVKVALNAFLSWHTFHGENAARFMFVALLVLGASQPLFKGTTSLVDWVFIAVALCFALALSFAPSVRAFFRANSS